MAEDLGCLSYFNDFEKRHPWDEDMMARAVEGIREYGRDNTRTPMQWDRSRQAGFSEATKTWMKVNPNFLVLNVADQEKDTNSILAFWKRILGMRKRGR